LDLFDFITQDEIDELPDDPAIAFMTFVRIAQKRLAQRTKKVDTSQEAGWDEVNEARFGFQNVILAAGKRFGIEPFLSMAMPRYDSYNSNNRDDYRQFKADLDHYMTQLVLDASDRGKRDSVLVRPVAKDKIRKYIHGLKLAIDQANFPEGKRATLLEILAKFEVELEKRRLNLLAVTKFVVQVLAVPGALWASYDIVSRLTTNILEVVSEEKVADDENRQLPPIEAPAALLPPRKEEPLRRSDSRGSGYGGGGGDLDDDIPF
jgi:hypothetical protein